jgi:hypothetical protein
LYVKKLLGFKRLTDIVAIRHSAKIYIKLHESSVLDAELDLDVSYCTPFFYLSVSKFEIYFKITKKIFTFSYACVVIITYFSGYL